jgi:hypothetical protein
MTEAKAFRTFNRIYSLFKSECLSTNIKLTFHKCTDQISNDLRLLRLGISSRYLPLKIAAPTKKKVFCINGTFPRCTLVRDLHMTFNLLYVYDYITKLCRQQAEVIQNHEYEHICSVQQGEARHRNYKKLKLDDGQAYNCSSD